MSRDVGSLASRHADLTQGAILEAAVTLLEAGPVNELSVRAIAREARMSERTVFRHFANREVLLDAVAKEVSRRLDAPADPSSIEELIAYPEAIYARFEAKSALTKAALHSELYHRIRRADALRRGTEIRKLIDRSAPERTARERELVAANVHYHVIATTWHYFRFYFGFSLDDSVAAARMAILQALKGLGIVIPDRRP